MIDNYLFCDNIRKHIRKERVKNTKSCKNYKQKFYKKYRIYNIDDNNSSNKLFIDNIDFDIKKNINKKLAILFKENINKILKNI